MRELHYILTLFVAALLSACTMQNSSLDYSMFHGNETHTGIYEQTNYNNFGEVKWKFHTNGKVFSSPAIVKGVAYVGSEDSNLYAVDVSTGTLKWKFHTNGAVASSLQFIRMLFIAAAMIVIVMQWMPFQVKKSGSSKRVANGKLVHMVCGP